MWRPTNIDRTTGVFIGLLVLAFALVTVDLRSSGSGIGATLRGGTQAVFSPIERVVATGTRPIADFFENVSDMLSLSADNRRLRLQVTDLQRQLQETDSLRVRVSELEAILGVDPPEGLDTITSQVLAVGVSEFDQIRVIDRGSSDGVGVDMPVIDEGGLIGRVIAVTDTTARIRLITDPTFNIAVRVERTGETGVLTGRGSGSMALELFNTDASVVEGDLLVTADGRFPAGIPVARVLQAARSEVGFALRTTATPSAALTAIDFVKVVVFTRDAATVGDFGGDSRLPATVPETNTPSEGDADEPPTTTSTTLGGSAP